MSREEAVAKSRGHSDMKKQGREHAEALGGEGGGTGQPRGEARSRSESWWAGGLRGEKLKNGRVSETQDRREPKAEQRRRKGVEEQARERVRESECGRGG